MIVRFGASLFYANTGYLVDQLRHLTDHTNPGIKHIVVDMERAPSVDITAMILIEKPHKDLERRGITLAFARTNDEIRSEFARMIEKQELKSLYLFDTISEAVSVFASKMAYMGESDDEA